MKPKNLVPLVVILVILIALVMVKKAKEPAPNIVNEVQLARLIPEGVSAPDIVKLELFAGAKPDEGVVLAWDDAASGWRVTSKYNAPVDEEKIDEYLSDLIKLGGEYRAAPETDADLEQYDLTDSRAFHVKGFVKGDDAPKFEVLVGKAPDYRTTFVRAAAGKEIYLSDVNLRQKAGIYGDDTEKAPEATPWLDKNIVDLEKDKISRIDLTYPDKSVVFEKREKEAEPEEKAGEQAEEPDEDAEEAPAPEKEKEYEWVLASGAPARSHKQTGLDSLLRKLDSLTATDVVDPGTPAEWGLEPPAFKCVVAADNLDEDVVIEAGRPDASGDGYLRLAGAEEPVVYKIPKYSFDQLFPKGRDLCDLPALSVDQKEIKRVELTQPAGDVVLTKSDGEWAVEKPRADLALQASTLDTVARTLASWQPADYAGPDADTGLDAATRRVSFIAGDVTHTIALGAPSPVTEGDYARLDDDPAALVMAKIDKDKVFVAPKDLYERSLLDIDEMDITDVTVKSGRNIYTLARRDDEWAEIAANREEGALSFEREKADAFPDDVIEEYEGAADSLTEWIADLQASDILFDGTTMQGEPFMAITFTLADGAKHEIAIGPESDGSHLLKVSGKKEMFKLDHADVETVLDELALFKAPAPEPEPATSGEGEESQQGDDGTSEAAIAPPAGEETDAAMTAVEAVPEAE